MLSARSLPCNLQTSRGGYFILQCTHQQNRWQRRGRVDIGAFWYLARYLQYHLAGTLFTVTPDG
jgi:hypothetical protein